MEIEITVLGFLMKENLYGYEIKKRIAERCANYNEIEYGSIDCVLEKAANNGWVFQIGIEEDIENPDRCSFQILPAGCTYYKKFLNRYFDTCFNIDTVLMFVKSLGLQKKIFFIGNRDEMIRNRVFEVQNKIDREEEMDIENP